MATSKKSATPALLDYRYNADGVLQLTFAVIGNADSQIKLFDDKNNNGLLDINDQFFNGVYQNGQWVFNTDYLAIGYHHYRSLEVGSVASQTVSINYVGIQPASQPPSIFFEEIQKNVNEDGSSSITLIVKLSSNRSTQPISVNYNTVDGTATSNDADYIATTGTLTFNTGETSKSITINGIPDNKYENNEFFKVILTNPVNARLDTTRQEAVIQLINDETPAVSIDALLMSDNIINKAEAESIIISGNSTDATGTTLSVTLIDESSLKSTTVTTLVTEDGIWSTAFSMSDLVDSGTGNLTVIADILGFSGQVITSSQTHLGFDLDAPSISIDNILMSDNIVDASEHKAVAISGLTSGTEAGQQVTITLTDNATTPNTASRIVTVATDGSWQLSDEQLVDISNWQQGAISIQATVSDAAGNPAEPAIKNITLDNPLPFIAFTQPTYSNAEGNDEPTIVTTTVNLSIASNLPVTVNYSTGDGTATLANSDYQSANGVLIFAPGETSKQISFTINNDIQAESDESFIVTLSDPIYGLLAPNNTVANIIILNDDFTVSLDNTAIYEIPGVPNTVTYQVTGAPNTVVQIALSGSADINDILFSDNVSDQQITLDADGLGSFDVTAIADLTLEDTETLTLLLSDGYNQATADTVSISDSTLIVSSNRTALYEIPGVPNTVTYQVTGAPNTVVQIALSGSADLRDIIFSDNVSDQQITLDANGLASFDVTAIADLTLEETETLTLLLSDGYNQATADTVSITDSTLIVSSNRTALYEIPGVPNTVTYQVTGAPNTVVQITLSGSADINDILFSDNVSDQQITLDANGLASFDVTAIADLTLEDTETLTLLLSDGYNQATADTVSITDSTLIVSSNRTALYEIPGVPNTVTYQVTGAPNTVVQIALSGSADLRDIIFSDNVSDQQITLDADGLASFDVTAIADLTLEDTESLTLLLSDGYNQATADTVSITDSTLIVSSNRTALYEIPGVPNTVTYQVTGAPNTVVQIALSGSADINDILFSDNVSDQQISLDANGLASFDVTAIADLTLEDTETLTLLLSDGYNQATADTVSITDSTLIVSSNRTALYEIPGEPNTVTYQVTGAPNTVVQIALSGSADINDILFSDNVSDLQISLDANGLASFDVTAIADLTLEEIETLTLLLSDGYNQATADTVSITDSTLIVSSNRTALYEIPGVPNTVTYQVTGAPNTVVQIALSGSADINDILFSDNVSDQQISLDANGLASFDVTAIADLTLEDTETLTLLLSDGYNQATADTVSITDSTLIVSSNRTALYEIPGVPNTVTYQVTGAPNTVIQIALSGSADINDILFSDNVSDQQITLDANGLASFDVTAIADLTLEETETLTLLLSDGYNQATADTVSISDSTLIIDRNRNDIKEMPDTPDTVSYQVTGAPNTLIQITLSGSADINDILFSQNVSEALQLLLDSNGQATFDVTAIADWNQESTETLTLAISDGFNQATADSVNIADSTPRITLDTNWIYEAPGFPDTVRYQIKGIPNASVQMSFSGSAVYNGLGSNQNDIFTNSNVFNTGQIILDSNGDAHFDVTALTDANVESTETFDVSIWYTSADSGAYADTLFIADIQPGFALISQDASGTAVGGYEPSISADGRYVAFASYASLVEADTNEDIDIYLRDTLTYQTFLISQDQSGFAAGGSYAPSISADGRYVAFETNFGEGGTDIYLRDTSDNLSILVSQGYAPSISANGRYVAFASYANLVIADDNSDLDIYLHDTQTNQNFLISQDQSGFAAGASYAPSISADGRYVAFESYANLVAADNNSDYDIYLRDTLNNQTILISQDPSGSAAGSSYSPSISADGRYVVFESYANLVAADTNSDGDIYLRDTQTNQTFLISQDPSGSAAGSSHTPSISADGRYVAFESDANLVAADTSNGTDIYLFDTQTNQTFLLAQDPSSFNTESGGHRLSISADGHTVAFDNSTDLVSADTNTETDVYMTNFNGHDERTLSLNTDTIVGSAGNNVFNAPLIGGVATLSSSDSVDGREGIDTLQAELSANSNTAPTLNNIEIINISAADYGANFDLTYASGVKYVNTYGDYPVSLSASNSSIFNNLYLHSSNGSTITLNTNYQPLTDDNLQGNFSLAVSSNSIIVDLSNQTDYQSIMVDTDSNTITGGSGGNNFVINDNADFNTITGGLAGDYFSVSNGADTNLLNGGGSDDMLWLYSSLYAPSDSNLVNIESISFNSSAAQTMDLSDQSEDFQIYFNDFQGSDYLILGDATYNLNFHFPSISGQLNIDTYHRVENFSGINNAGNDIIHLSKYALTALPNTLTSDNFVANAAPVAADADDFLLYNTSTGMLSYDADGSGEGIAIDFLQLIGAPLLSVNDFIIS